MGLFADRNLNAELQLAHKRLGHVEWRRVGRLKGNLSLFMEISSIHGAICCEWFKSEKCHKMRKHNVKRKKKTQQQKTLHLSETWTSECVTSESLFLKMVCKSSARLRDKDRWYFSGFFPPPFWSNSFHLFISSLLIIDHVFSFSLPYCYGLWDKGELEKGVWEPA